MPTGERRVLAERLLQPETDDEHAAMIAVQRFAEATQARFEALMKRHSEGALTEWEHGELRALVERYAARLLKNSQAVLHATRPELFARSGRLVKRRVPAALQRKRARSRTGHGR